MTAEKRVATAARFLSGTLALYAVLTMVSAVLHVLLLSAVLIQRQTLDTLLFGVFPLLADVVTVALLSGMYMGGRALEEHRDPGYVALAALICVLLPVFQVPASFVGCAVNAPVWCLLWLWGFIAGIHTLRTLADPDVRLLFGLLDASDESIDSR